MSGAAAAAAGPRTCTACGLVCADIVPAGGRFTAACETGTRALAPPAAASAAAWREGRPLEQSAAVDAAAAALAAARRVLVTGFGGATLEAAARACDVAETLAAAVDAGAADCDRPAGPMIARAGEVTADWEELRDRADLVVFWQCDPSATHPRFLERFVVPPPAGGARRVLVVGAAWPAAAAVPHEHVPLAPAAGIDAAREIQTILGGRHLPRSLAREPAAPAAAAERIAAAIDAARCVAIVTADTDPAGLAGWSLAHLVRTIAHAKPAFELPLGGAGPAGGRAAAAVCTWRYGAAGAIERAVPGILAAGTEATAGQPPAFLPGEASARKLIARGEVDAVLVAGRAAAAVESALAAAGGPLVVRIDDGPPSAGESRTIRLACASLAGETTGTMLRGDGRTVRLEPVRAPRLPLLEDVLADLLAALRARLPDPGASGSHDHSAGAAGVASPAGGSR